MNTVSNNTENRPRPNLVGSPKIESKSSANFIQINENNYLTRKLKLKIVLP